ncbi:hypothetical protein CERSUDRAFT_150918 [Gelatoporia subvermispora B]|uniref:NAD-dependent epimerase/dehydratase domain-containing protein n=1 Tax=Ceriporiopsis subvermispora (strain B) TaxID=914234 RepID=M2RMF5_CERS8|nr:hypothetical protein CERSUDRAFT_150918 [Gelatoporia subvermispora B]
MKVIVLGASGFIGLPAAQALVRAGHIVYGVTRSASKAKQLAAEEIIPVVANYDDISAWGNLIATVDAVIDAVGGTDVKTLSAALLTKTAHAAQELRPLHAPKLIYIYTSGTWVHGDDRKTVKTDTSPLTAPVEQVAWRPAQEQRVVTNTALNGIVIRPSLLYGRSGSLLANVFRGAYEGKVKWFGTPGGRFALIHTDDLGELYRLVAEKGAIIGGKIFDASNDVSESVDDFLQKLVEVSGAKGPYEYVQPSNLFEVALTTTAILRPYLARSLLGWQLRKAGLTDHLEIYYDAWKASEGLA